MQLFTLITGPVGRVLGLILLMSVFGLGLGTMNSWFLQTVDAGVVNNERLDRIVKKGSNTADEAWAAVTSTKDPDIKVPNPGNQATVHNPSATKGHVVEEGTNGGCRIGRIRGGNTSARDISVVAAVYYTPIGTEVTVPAAQADGHVSNPETADIAISGCKWEKESKIFKQAGMGGLIAIVLQAVGLAGPVLLLTEVGSFAGSFARKAGGHPILSIIITLIVLLLVGTMMQTFIPFLDDAFAAIDSKRFLMYDSGLGKLATVISSFLGVVLVAGLLMLAWGLWQNLRGGNLLAGAGGQRM